MCLHLCRPPSHQIPHAVPTVYQLLSSEKSGVSVSPSLPTDFSGPRNCPLRRQRPVDSRKGVKVAFLNCIPGTENFPAPLRSRTKFALRRNLADSCALVSRSPKPEWFVEIDLIQNQVVDPPIERLLSRPCWSREYVCVVEIILSRIVFGNFASA